MHDNAGPAHAHDVHTNVAGIMDIGLRVVILVVNCVVMDVQHEPGHGCGHGWSWTWGWERFVVREGPYVFKHKCGHGYGAWRGTGIGHGVIMGVGLGCGRLLRGTGLGYGGGHRVLVWRETLNLALATGSSLC